MWSMIRSRTLMHAKENIRKWTKKVIGISLTNFKPIIFFTYELCALLSINK